MNVENATNQTRWRNLVATTMRAARKTKKFSQEEMGKLLGCSQSLISKYESGTAVPPSDVFMHCIHISGSGFFQPTLELEGDPHWVVVVQALNVLNEAVHSANQHLGAVAAGGQKAINHEN